MNIIKYPRTQHIEGSRLQQGDEDLEQVPFKFLIGKNIVIEEKVDGASTGISFDEQEKLYLQSRGHFLTGGPRELQFTLFKQWANTHKELWNIALGDQYIAYGEWLGKKHSVYYDKLPHYWMEFDVLDKKTNKFLDTDSRNNLLKGMPYVSVPVLWRGICTKELNLADFIKPSLYKSPIWKENLKNISDELGYNWDVINKHTDASNLAEGVYIKWEEDGEVKGRFKYVRHDFVSLIVANDEHHFNLPPVPNKLDHNINIFN
jgi:hypothetical protein